MAVRFDEVVNSGVLPYEVLHVVALTQEARNLILKIEQGR